MGRATKDNQIDVDLSLEGPAWKISRRQGIIKLRSNGDFYIANEGKRPLYIDGKPILTGNKQRLSNNSVVEVRDLVYFIILLKNHCLLDSLVVECWYRVREVPGSIPSQGPRHTKDIIKMVPGSSLV